MNCIKRMLIENVIGKDDFPTIKENILYSQELTKTGSWTYDLDKNEFFWSDEIYNILESSPELLKEGLESFTSYVHPEDQKEGLEGIQGLLEGKEYDIEYRIITPTGLTKYVHEKTKALYDENDNLVKVIGIIQDITNKKIIENNLKELGDHLNKAQRVAGVGSWKYDVIQEEFFWSEEIYNIYNINPDNYNLNGKDVLRLIHPEDRSNVETEIRKALEGKDYELEYRIPQKDGSERHVISKGNPLFDEKGQAIGILGTLQDITEKRVLKNEIKKIQKTFQVLIQESKDVFEIIKADGTIKYVSGSIEKTIGSKPEEIIGKKIYDFYEGKELEKIKKMIEVVLSSCNKEVQSDVVFKTILGKEIYLELYMKNLLHDPDINGIAINFRDITRRIKMEKRMVHISTHDKLTGLPNSIYCTKQLRISCQYAEDTNTKFALMMLDISGLKYVNYSLGYKLGDELIIKVVERLKDYLGNNFLSRFSDGHFAIIVEEKDNKKYEDIAQDLINLLSSPFKVRSYELDISVNVGICICPDDTQDVDSIAKKSKVAMLRSKREGKNAYGFFCSELNIQSYKESVLRSDLHSAIEKEQLQVYYQPIVDLKTNEILGAEALIRWEHPEWGIVLPDEFIFLAEETGLIINIGKWILDKVCIDYKQWRSIGLPNTRVGINISGIQFLEKNFVNNIKDIINKHDLDPSFLTIEITENILIKNINKVNSDIERLQAMGIRIALDDFGTGYSSLIYLISFNIDILKFDKSFIKNIPSDETSTAITKSIANLAKELKIKMVIEGIEDQDQLSYVRSLNCYGGQGYIYNKPMPVKDFEKVLARRKCKPLLYGRIPTKPQEERRKYFRVKFFQLLETDLTILEIKGRKIDIGNTKVLVKDIGPGGLSFISNIKFPVQKDVILQFSMELIEKKIKVYGHPVWMEEIDDEIYEHGVKLTIDENERGNLIGDLNQVQIKIRQNMAFAEGSFISGSYSQYFNQ